MNKGYTRLVFSKLKESGALTPQTAINRSQVAKLTGLSEQQCSAILHALSMQKKYLGRDKVNNHDGSWFYKYWVMREPARRYTRRRATTQGSFASKANYKVSITGPELVMEQAVNGATVRTILAQLIM